MSTPTATRRGALLGGLALALVLGAGGAYWAQRGADGQTAFAVPAAANAGEAALLPDIPLGAEDAPVTMIEYASFTCPHCADFHARNWDNLKRDYIDTGKVRFIHREVYFDGFGLMAAQVANCGGVTRYYPVAGMIYDEQKAWIGDGKPETIEANLRKIGLKAGLTQEALETCLKDEARAEQMVATFQSRATADGVEGTPTLFIDGEKFPNMDWTELKAALDAALAKKGA